MKTKKLFTLLTAGILLFATSSFAIGQNNVVPIVQAAFEKDFTLAKDVTWTEQSNFYFAWFTMNGILVNAAYNDLGELVCTSRDIETSLLPLNVTMALSKDYSDYTIPEFATEINYEGATNYYLIISNPNQSLKLQFSANGQLNKKEKIRNK